MVNELRDRTGKGLFKRNLKGVERDAECARMRAGGYLLREIAEHLGMTPGSVKRAIDRALRDVQAPAVEALRAAQQSTLDLLKSTALDIMSKPHIAHSNGKTVRVCPGLDENGRTQHPNCKAQVAGYDGDPDDWCIGVPVLDHGPRLSAIGQLRGLLEREAKLWGTDSPVRTIVEGDELVIRIKGVDTEGV
jgi:hypothetical protein